MPTTRRKNKGAYALNRIGAHHLHVQPAATRAGRSGLCVHNSQSGECGSSRHGELKRDASAMNSREGLFVCTIVRVVSVGVADIVS